MNTRLYTKYNTPLNIPTQFKFCKINTHSTHVRIYIYIVVNNKNKNLKKDT